MNEFDIIKQFFTENSVNSHICLGVGDDAAILNIPMGCQLVTSIDTSVAGVHFPKTTTADDIGYKSLAVSLSDIAAMGAQPISVLLALTLPTADPDWLRAFSTGFFSLAHEYNVSLIGGDITRGPLTISTQVNGIIATNKALCRHQGKPGDNIYITGTLGDASYALKLLEGKSTNDIPPSLLQRLNRPQPRVLAGLTIRELAHAAIDISDGLVADLTHILHASSCGANIYSEALPISPTLKAACTAQQYIEFALYGGDDYELCFTAPPELHSEITQQLTSVPITLIGQLTAISGLKIYDKTNNLVTIKRSGYQHFKENE